MLFRSVPLGILIGGEELHNNHHAYASSAKLSNKWYEFDIGWLYIRILEALRLARVKKLPPTPRSAPAKPAIDLETLQAVIANRYDVLAKYAKSLKATYAEELKRLAPHDARVLRRLKRWLTHEESRLEEVQRSQIEDGLARSKPLSTVYAMRRDLLAIWERSHASRDQLVRQLQEWCQRAEATGIRPLVEFSRGLRCYA